jgi:hypothetical protein
MWGKMAKAAVPVKEKIKPEIKVPPSSHKSYFPKFMMFFGIALVAVAVLDYLNFFSLPKLAVDIIILISGLWIFKLGIANGIYKKRKEVLKRYI